MVDFEARSAAVFIHGLVIDTVRITAVHRSGDMQRCLALMNDYFDEVERIAELPTAENDPGLARRGAFWSVTCTDLQFDINAALPK